MKWLAYSFAFFFGPGFALGLDDDSVPVPALLFVPALIAGAVLLFASSSPAWRDGVTPSTGVEFVSDAVSFDEAEATRGVWAGVDDEDDLDLEVLRVGSWNGKRASFSGDNGNLTILLGFDVFDERSDDREDEMAGVEFLVDILFNLS